MLINSLFSKYKGGAFKMLRRHFGLRPSLRDAGGGKDL